MRLILAIILMLMLNVGLFMFQNTLDNVANDESLAASPSVYNYNSSYASKFDAGGYRIVETQNNATGYLPSTGSSASSGITTIIVDIGSQMIGWITDSIGLKYIWAVVDAVPHFLTQIGLPDIFSFILGVLWHAMTVVLIIIFIRGGGY